jgi:nucleoside-diphosphate-sugar epimerase
MVKKIFITGAEGFIGSHITEKLLKLGYRVNALVLYNFSGDIGNLKFIKRNKNLNIIFGDIGDVGTYKKYLINSDIVINLASLISIPYSYRASLSYFQNNIIGTSNLLLACKNLNIKKFIHFSSSEIYGTPKKLPITENTPINPQSPYAASKVSIDQIAKSFYFSYGLPVVIIRPFNNYGPRQSRRAVIPEIICQILGKNQIKLGDINTKRDFLYVSDTVNAVLKIINKNSVIGEEFNIGSNNFYKIKDIVNVVSEIIDKKVSITLDKKRLRPKNSEIKYLLCDYGKAKRLLGWKPIVLNKKQFYNSISTTIEFYKKNLESIEKIYFHD